MDVFKLVFLFFIFQIYTQVWNCWIINSPPLSKSGLSSAAHSRASGTTLTSVTQLCLFVTPWTVAHQTSLSITISRSLLKPTSIESVMPSNHLILCVPLLLLPSIFPSIRVFSISSHQVAKVLEFQHQHQSSNEYSELISLSMNWLDLLAVQGTLKSLLQHHSFKSISSSALSFLYGPTLTSIHDYWRNHSFD